MSILQGAKDVFFFFYDDVYLKYLMTYAPAIAIALRNFVVSVISFEIAWYLICVFFGGGNPNLYKSLAGFSMHPINQIIFIAQAFYLGINYRITQYSDFFQKAGDYFSNLF